MDERSETIPVSERAGPSCAVDRSCCGGGPEVALIDESCTLDPAEMPERLARWQTLFRQVLGHDAGEGEAVFRFERTTALGAELQELVKLEQICCAHVRWELMGVGDEIHLTLKSDAGALESLVTGLMSGESGGAS
jgi:hypothetical protein